jgi:hypothetical protein
LADVPASYSTTSYYGGRTDGYGPRAEAPGYHSDGQRADHGWGAPVHSDRFDPAADAAYGGGAPWADPAVPASRSGRRSQSRRAVRQRGVPGWLALVVLLVISGIGGLIDTISGSAVRGGFNLALVIASVVAILIVRHRDMFPIVVAPPLVYVVASAALLYVRSDYLHNRKIIIDAAANWLVYGFPAIAGASAAVLIIAGIRLVIGK